MGKLLDTLIGKSNTLDENNFKPFDHTNESLNTHKAMLELKTTVVTNKSDMLKVEQAIKSGDIILMEIDNLTSGLTEEELLNFLNDTVRDINGDIVQRNSSEYIITPSSVHISRSKL